MLTRSQRGHCRIDHYSCQQAVFLPFFLLVNQLHRLKHCSLTKLSPLYKTIRDPDRSSSNKSRLRAHKRRECLGHYAVTRPSYVRGLRAPEESASRRDLANSPHNRDANTTRRRAPFITPSSRGRAALLMLQLAINERLEHQDCPASYVTHACARDRGRVTTTTTRSGRSSR